jgi:hypothetical protein
MLDFTQSHSPCLSYWNTTRFLLRLPGSSPCSLLPCSVCVLSHLVSCSISILCSTMCDLCGCPRHRCVICALHLLRATGRKDHRNNTRNMIHLYLGHREVSYGRTWMEVKDASERLIHIFQTVQHLILEDSYRKLISPI